MIKEKVLELFESNRGVYFSGEEIAKSLSVSRTAVWKAVKSLQNEGYHIDAVTNKGYCLSEGTDILSSQGIKKYLCSNLQDMEIQVMPTVTSTNTIVREKANAGKAEGYLVLANEQTYGRGRRGRSFFSPQETGIYMSLLLRPKQYSPSKAVSITTMAAVSMCEAIEAVSDKKPEIKWVNDIFIEGKKVCGILTEGSFDMESGIMEYAVLGIGINVYPPESGVPNELQEIAGVVFNKRQNDVKNRLVSEFLNSFHKYYDVSLKNNYVEEYRKRCFVIGRQVTVKKSDKNKTAFVMGIDDDCRLLVKYADGTQDCLSSGEISIEIGG